MKHREPARHPERPATSAATVRSTRLVLNVLFSRHRQRFRLPAVHRGVELSLLGCALEEQVRRHFMSPFEGITIVDLLFLRPGNESAAQALGLLRSLLADTDGEVRIAVAYFTHQLLVDKILRRKEQGRVTYLLLNSADFLRPAGPNETEVVVAQSVIDLLKAADYGLLEVKTLGQASGKYQNMHHKFVVTDRAVAFGSMNWTKSALANNYEFFAVSNDASLISQFRQEFDVLWRDAQEMYTGQGDRLRSIMCPICQEQSGVDFESYGPVCTCCGHRFRVVGG